MLAQFVQPGVVVSGSGSGALRRQRRSDHKKLTALGPASACHHNDLFLARGLRRLYSNPTLEANMTHADSSLRLIVLSLLTAFVAFLPAPSAHALSCAFGPYPVSPQAGDNDVPTNALLYFGVAANAQGDAVLVEEESGETIGGVGREPRRHLRLPPQRGASAEHRVRPEPSRN